MPVEIPDFKERVSLMKLIYLTERPAMASMLKGHLFFHFTKCKSLTLQYECFIVL